MSDSPHTSSGEPEQRLLKAVKATLDRSEQDLDGATLTRLRAARREALGALATEDHRPCRSWWEPLSGLAVAATLATLTVSLWSLSPGPDDTLDDGFPALEDVALLTDAEELEFYQDLDFYLWLDSDGPETLGPGATKRGGHALGGDQKTG